MKTTRLDIVSTSGSPPPALPTSRTNHDRLTLEPPISLRPEPPSHPEPRLIRLERHQQRTYRRLYHSRPNTIHPSSRPRPHPRPCPSHVHGTSKRLKSNVLYPCIGPNRRRLKTKYKTRIPRQAQTRQPRTHPISRLARRSSDVCTAVAVTRRSWCRYRAVASSPFHVHRYRLPHRVVVCLPSEFCPLPPSCLLPFARSLPMYTAQNNISSTHGARSSSLCGGVENGRCGKWTSRRVRRGRGLGHVEHKVEFIRGGKGETVAFHREQHGQGHSEEAPISHHPSPVTRHPFILQSHRLLTSHAIIRTDDATMRAKRTKAQYIGRGNGNGGLVQIVSPCMPSDVDTGSLNVLKAILVSRYLAIAISCVRVLAMRMKRIDRSDQIRSLLIASIGCSPLHPFPAPMVCCAGTAPSHREATVQQKGRIGTSLLDLTRLRRSCRYIFTAAQLQGSRVAGSQSCRVAELKRCRVEEKSVAWLKRCRVAGLTSLAVTGASLVPTHAEPHRRHHR